MPCVLLLQWEHRVEKSQEEFEAISKSIVKEMKRFERQRLRDFKRAVVVYLESLMANQQQVATLYIALYKYILMAPSSLSSSLSFCLSLSVSFSISLFCTSLSPSLSLSVYVCLSLFVSLFYLPLSSSLTLLLSISLSVSDLLPFSVLLSLSPSISFSYCHPLSVLLSLTLSQSQSLKP